MPSETLVTRFMAWRGTSAQVKLYCRELSDGSIPGTAENLRSFEGALLALDVEAVSIITDAVDLVRKSGELIRGALDLLDDAAAKQEFPTEQSVGDILAEAQAHRSQVRMDGPVYVPNDDRGWLEDMATPNSNVVPIRQPLGRSVS